MDSEINLMTFPQRSEEEDSFTWNRGVAAGSLLAGAVLLITGYRRAGLAVAAAGAAVALLENPDAVRNFWNAIPDAVHAGQDFLSRAESLIDDVNRQTARVRRLVSREV